LSKADGTLGSFRPADDVLEEAITLLVKAAFRNKDPSMSISEQDLHDFASLQCVRSALQRLCDIKGNLLLNCSRLISRVYLRAAITPEIVVYRYSLPKLLKYLRVKVARLATTAMMEQSRTLIRSLAKDGLMEDGKEDLLECLF
jgi:ribonuclease H2 subunit B